MDLTSTMLLSIVPAALFLIILLRLERNAKLSANAQINARHELFFLAVTALVLLLIGEIAARLPLNSGNWLVFGLPFLLLPTILSALALVLFHLPRWLFLERVEKITFLFLMVGIASLLALAFRRTAQVGELFPACLPVVLVVLLVRRKFQGLLWCLNVLYLGLLVLLNIDSFQIQLLSFSPWLRATVSILYFSLPGMIVALPAITILSVLRGIDRERPGLDTLPSNKIPWRVVLQIGFAILMVIALVYTTFWSSIWDQTSDGLGGIFFVMFATPVSIAAGLLMMLLTTGPRRWAGIVFLIIVPLVTYAAFIFGWEVPYKQWTEQRAKQVQQAIEQYHNQTGSYPPSLKALVPKYLLAVPNPIFLRGEDWCYQGGADGYRLGVIYREAFSAPLSLRIYGSVGEHQGSWLCDDRLAELKKRYDPQMMVSPPE